jgi:hypothetical protein
MTVRNFTPETIESYVQCIARFERYFKSSPEQPSPEDVRV